MTNPKPCRPSLTGSSSGDNSASPIETVIKERPLNNNCNASNDDNPNVAAVNSDDSDAGLSWTAFLLKGTSPCMSRATPCPSAQTLHVAAGYR